MFNRILIKTLKKTISNLEKDLDVSKMQIRERDKLIQNYQEEHEILLENSSELREKIIDLENNIEVLYNTLPKSKRELIRPSNQD